MRKLVLNCMMLVGLSQISYVSCSEKKVTFKGKAFREDLIGDDLSDLSVSPVSILDECKGTVPELKVLSFLSCGRAHCVKLSDHTSADAKEPARNKDYICDHEDIVIDGVAPDGKDEK